MLPLWENLGVSLVINPDVVLTIGAGAGGLNGHRLTVRGKLYSPGSDVDLSVPVPSGRLIDRD